MGEAERVDERGHRVELLEERVVEHPPGLIAGERLVPVVRHLERVPADDHRVRPHGVPEPLEEAGETNERARRTPTGAANRLGQTVVGAVCERVAVYGEQRAHGQWLPSRNGAGRMREVISGEYRGSRPCGYRGPLTCQQRSHPAGAVS